MLELMDNLSAENLVLICFILGTIALALAIAISIEIYFANKKYSALMDATTSTLNKLNIKEDTNVKYVVEDEELEKTKAKLELQALKDKLRKEEEEKKKLMELNLALAKEDKKEKVETKQEQVVSNVNVTNNVQKTTEIKEQIKETNITNEKEYSDEDNAIISYEELKNQYNKVDTEDNRYVDEEDAIISIQELEKLYNESKEITEPYSYSGYNSANAVNNSYVSPIYARVKTDQDLVLEQTANLEKLNEEIKKTNEFLNMLKDLKKNLE